MHAATNTTWTATAATVAVGVVAALFYVWQHIRQEAEATATRAPSSGGTQQPQGNATAPPTKPTALQAQPQSPQQQQQRGAQQQQQQPQQPQQPHAPLKKLERASGAAGARVAPVPSSSARWVPEPGMDVVLQGLKSKPQLNGQQGIVKPTKDWPANGRIAVLLVDTAPKSTIAVKPTNLKPWSPACFVCLKHSFEAAEAPPGCHGDGYGHADSDPDGAADANSAAGTGAGTNAGAATGVHADADAGGQALLLATGCGCRGSAGWAHGGCMIASAASQQGRAGVGGWAGPGRYPWQLCPTCKVPYTGDTKLVLAKEWCKRAVALGLPREDPQRFAASTALGNALSANGRLAEAEAMVRANLLTATRVHGADNPRTLGTSMNLGLLLSNQGKAKEAEAIYTTLVATQGRILGVDHRDTLATAMNLAGAVLSQGRSSEAETRYTLVYEALKRVLGEAHPYTLMCEMNLGNALLNQAKYKEAEAVFARNLKQKVRRLGADHPDTLMVHMNLGAVLKERGRFSQALAIFRDNNEAKRRVLGKGHLDTCLAVLNLVATWVQCGQGTATGAERADHQHVMKAMAQPCIASTHYTLVNKFGAKHPTTLAALMHYGSVLIELGDLVLAAELLGPAFEDQKETLGHQHPSTLETAWRLGALMSLPGTEIHSLDASVQLLQDTAARQEAVLGSTHPGTLRTLLTLGEVLLAVDVSTGRTDNAAKARGLFIAARDALAEVLDADHPDLRRAVGFLLPPAVGNPP